MTLKRRGFLALVGALAPALLMGCKPEEKAETTTSTGNAPALSKDKIKVVYIPKNTGNPYFEAITAAMEKTCKEQGVEFSSNAPAKPDATAQIPLILDEVQRGATVLCLSPNSVDALNSTLDEVRKKGVKVVTIDADLTGNESHRDAAVLQTDFDALGENQVEQMGKLMNYEGKFAILSATTDAPNQNHWIAGMKEALKKPQYAKMELVEVVYGNDEPEKSLTEANGLLTKYPDLKGITAPTTVGVAATAKAVETAGVYPGGKSAKNGGVLVTGLGFPTEMSRYLKEGIVPAVALWDLPAMGQLAAMVAIGLAKGEIKTDEGAKVTISGQPERAFGKNAIVITGPPVVFTKENVDQYQF